MLAVGNHFTERQRRLLLSIEAKLHPRRCKRDAHVSLQHLSRVGWHGPHRSHAHPWLDTLDTLDMMMWRSVSTLADLSHQGLVQGAECARRSIVYVLALQLRSREARAKVSDSEEHGKVEEKPCYFPSVATTMGRIKREPLVERCPAIADVT